MFAIEGRSPERQYLPPVAHADANRARPIEDPKGEVMRTVLRQSIATVFRLVSLASVVAGPIFAVGQVAHDHAAPAKLVQIVRAATQQYIDVNNASPDYVPLFGCVSGPDHGAMGIHYVNVNLLNGQIDASHPQALIYEPVGNARRLVGVEYIVDAPTWLADKSHQGLPPQ